MLFGYVTRFSINMICQKMRLTTLFWNLVCVCLSIACTALFTLPHPNKSNSKRGKLHTDHCILKTRLFARVNEVSLTKRKNQALEKVKHTYSQIGGRKIKIGQIINWFQEFQNNNNNKYKLWANAGVKAATS